MKIVMTKIQTLEGGTLGCFPFPCLELARATVESFVKHTGINVIADFATKDINDPQPDPMTTTQTNAQN